MYTDPSGDFWHLVVGALIGGTINWAMNGCQWNAQGLVYFGVGALAGALGAGVGAGVSSVLGGASFGAGFVGSQAAATATSSFLTGAAIGGSGGFASGFVNGFGNGLIQKQTVGDALESGLKSGAIAGISGAVGGGIAGGWDAYRDNRNVWTGEKVNVGRTRFSMINNKPIPENKLHYVDENGNVIRMKQFNTTSKELNPRHYQEGYTCDRYTHDMDLEYKTKPPTEVSVKIPQKQNIKGFAEIKTGKYYWPEDGGVDFTTNNGLSVNTYNGAESITFPSRGLKTVNAKIYGTGYNDGAVYAPNSFRIILRIKY